MEKILHPSNVDNVMGLYRGHIIKVIYGGFLVSKGGGDDTPNLQVHKHLSSLAL